MLNYEEELKKFTPCLDVEDVEASVYQQDMTDVIDLLKEMEMGRGGFSRRSGAVDKKEPEL